MHRFFDRALDSDEDGDYFEDSEEEKLRKREMLVDEILEGYDAKLEQEKEKKLKAARCEQEKAIKLAEQRFAKTVVSSGNTTLHTTTQQAQITSRNIRIANVSSNNNVLKSKYLVHKEQQSASSWTISNKTLVKHNSFPPQVKTGTSPQPNQKKVFVRISQSAALQPKPAVKYGTSASSTGLETVPKTNGRVQRTETGPDDIINISDLETVPKTISDPFSDLPSDLLPGLYELPNHGFHEVHNNSIITSDSDEDSTMTETTIQHLSQAHTQGTHRSEQGKTDEDLVKITDRLNAGVKLDTANDIHQSVDNQEAANDDNGLNDLGTAEDDGPYVVLVIPKHATVDDIMRVLKKAGKGPGTCNEIHKIIAKRKSANPRKAAFKRRRLEEKQRQLMIEKKRLESTVKQDQLITVKPEQPITIKQEPKEEPTELNASSTLTAMSRLVAAEKGITENVPTISDTVTKPEIVENCDSVMANVVHEEFVCKPRLQDHDYPMLQQHDYSLFLDNEYQNLSDPPQDPEHVEFGLSNDHTYATAATLLYGIALPEIVVPLAEPVTEVTVKTEATNIEPVTEVAEVMMKEEIKEEDIQVIEEATTQVVKEEEQVVIEAVEDVVMDTTRSQNDQPSGEEDMKEPQNHTADYDLKPTRWSHRINQNKKIKPSKCNKKPKKSHYCKEKIIPPQRPLLPAKYRCRLCEVMYRKVEDMKEHIVQVHSTQKAPVSVTRRRRDRVVNTSAMLSDFEVSALSAIVRLCPTCDKYVPENRIEAHMDNHAPQKHRKVVCDNCGTSYSNATYLNLHKRRCQGNGQFKCDDCDNTYPSMCSLQDHRKKHIDDERPVKCERCGKECRNYRALKSHIAVHFSVKPYECPECGKGFSQRTNMENHRLVHTIDTPYKCDLCKEKFSQSTSLKTHKKKKHGVNMR